MPFCSCVDQGDCVVSSFARTVLVHLSLTLTPSVPPSTFNCFQVSCHPFMAVGMEEEIITRHRDLALKGDPVHSRIRANLIPVFHLIKVNTKSSNRWNPNGSHMSKFRKRAGNIFFNYNTVESVLLFCAILVAIAGIMFTSGQLSTSTDSADGQVRWCRCFHGYCSAP